MSLLVSIIYTLISTVYSQPEALCLWGRVGLDPGGGEYFHREMNGLYRLGPEEANNAPYWKLDLSASNYACTYQYMWLFWYGSNSTQNGGWYIGSSATQVFAFGIDGFLLAKCTGTVGNGATGGSYPTDCGANWAFAFDSGAQTFDTIDPAVTVSSGACPTLDCAQLSASWSGGSGTTCTGTFTQTGKDNYYTNAVNTQFWWFNVPQFKWYCHSDETSTDQTCVTDMTNIVQLIEQQPWQGVTGTLVYSNAQSSFGNTGTVTFTCTGNNGATTTFLPTTPNPTTVPPTPKPTFVTPSPTGVTTSPTAVTPAPLQPGETAAPVPTVSPIPTTVNPTILDPTQSPTNPSNNPTFYPSNNPITTVPIPSPTRSPLKFCADNGYNHKKKFQNKNDELCEFCVCTDIGNEYCATIATISEDVQNKFMTTCGFDIQCSFNQIGLKHSDDIKECGCEMFECQPITNDGYAILVGFLMYFAIVNVVFVQ